MTTLIVASTVAVVTWALFIAGWAYALRHRRRFERRLEEMHPSAFQYEPPSPWVRHNFWTGIR